MSNPFFEPVPDTGVPAFDKIAFRHYREAFDRGFAEQLELTGGPLRLHRVDAAREEAGGGVEVPKVGGLLGKEEARCGSDERSSWCLNPCTCTPAYRPGCTDRTDRTERTR